MRKNDYMNQGSAQKYREARFPGKGGAIIEEHERTFILSSIDRYLKNRSKYLDYAGGTGRALKYVADHTNFKSFNLLDSSKYMIEQAQQFLGKTKVNFILVDQEKAPKPLDETYDLVTTFHFIKHIPDPRVYFELFGNSQVKGGLLMFDFLNKNSVVMLNKETCYLYSKQQIAQYLNEAGYEVVSSKHAEMLGETIYISNILPHPIKQIFEKIDSFLSSTLLKPFASKIIIAARKVDK